MKKQNATTILPFENYTEMTHPEIWNVSSTVEGNMSLHVDIFPHPPVSLEEVKANNDAYAALIAEAADGSKRVIAQRDKQGGVVVTDLRLLARYVNKIAKGDIVTFKLSGFVPALKAPAAKASLSRNFRKLAHGPISGQVLVYLKKVPNAIIEVHWAPLTDGAPGDWVSRLAINVQKPMVLNGLTPGVTYAFQARSMDKTGYSDWSDSVTFMCV